MIDAFPAVHTLTGAEYSASFVDKGKLRYLNLVLKYPTFTTAFASFGNSGMAEETVSADMEKNHMHTQYCIRRYGDINEVCLVLFQQMLLKS